MAEDPYAEFGGSIAKDPYAEFGGSVQSAQNPEQSGFFKSLADTTGIPQYLENEAAQPKPTSLWDATKQGLKRAFTDSPPVQAYNIGKGIVSNAVQHVGAAGGALSKGDISGAASEYAGAVPIFGPMAYKAGQQAKEGNYAGAAGTAVGAIGQAALPELAERLPGVGRAIKNKIVPNINNPTVETALKAAEPNVRMSVGQRAGQQNLQRVEQNLPGAQQYAQAQQQDLATTGNALAARQSPVQTDAVGSGQAVNARLQQRITRLKGQADNIYGQVRQGAASNQQAVQTGATTSPIVGPTGAPIQTPVMQVFDSPVDLAPYRAQLQPMYDDLLRLMPEGRRAASPAFRSLQDLMTSPDAYMNAMDFDKSLGAIKSIARDGESPYLTSRSQGIARQLVKHGEDQLNSALAAADPSLPGKLKTARNIVRSYYDTADLRQSLNASSQEPAALYNHIVTGGDGVVNSLGQLAQVAPKELKTVGRTFLEGLMDKATNEGGFARAPGIMAQWERLGPRTKQLLFGNQTADIDNFMLAAKTLTKDFNPSGTARMATAMGSLGAIGGAIYEAMTGHPGVAAGIGGGVVASRVLAKMLLKPGGAKAALAQLSPFMRGASRAPLAAGTANAAPPTASVPLAASNLDQPPPFNPQQQQDPNQPPPLR